MYDVEPNRYQSHILKWYKGVAKIYRHTTRENRYLSVQKNSLPPHLAMQKRIGPPNPRLKKSPCPPISILEKSLCPPKYK